MKNVLEIDREACRGAGLCAAMQPDLFRLDDDCAVAVKSVLETTEDIAAAQDVAECCPNAAVLLTPTAPTE